MQANHQQRRLETIGVRMWLVLIGVTAALCASAALAQDGDCQNVARDWQAFERAVRDALAPRDQLQHQLQAWPQRLNACFAVQRLNAALRFPPQGYGLRHAGRDAHGANGFAPKGYAFLDGNRHGGHPAVDFFVADTNQDGLDDRTGHAIAVLALADGVVLSLCDDWRPQGPMALLRGGNYIWLYHPALDLFSYYAHLGAVGVTLGRTVTAGEPIATLGRSGHNAYPKRSPTHLHLMVLRAEDMTPVSPPDLLQKSEGGKR